jgi:hypothetical protein
MTIAWADIENRLYELCASEIRRFAKANSDETFYAFALDCNSEYGDVLLCLNTPDELRRGGNDVRWSLGDWKYQGFESGEFEKAWRRYARSVTEACMEEEEDERTFLKPTQDQFMRTACRVLVRLELTNVFESLRRTDDFKTWVADHDELDEESWGRLDSVRQQMASA